MVSKIIRICEKNKVSLSNKMNWKKGHDTKIVSYHSIFSPYNQESATFQKCRNSRQSGCLPRVIGHLPSSQVTFHRFFLGLEACPILPWPFQPPSQHFRQRHYHLNLTPGHNVSHLQGLALEQVKIGDPFIFILKAREHLLISKFNSFRCGLNKQR